MSQYGFSALNQNLNANNNNNFNVNTSLEVNQLIQSVRVLSIVLDETHPRFKELGGWNALGTIEYESVSNPLPSPQLPTAKPLDGNNKNLPLINEIVYIIALPSTNINTITSNTINYYLNPVSLWNHPHHNAYPTTPNALPPTQQKDYIQTETGNVRRVTDQSTEIFLGKTFKERSNIHPLLPFEGDIIYEGRWGNSIRFGSTNKRKIAGIIPDALNNWSKGKSTSGDPIIIFRNGQGTQTEEGWIPITENINNDDASIYLTSTQKIPLKTASSNYFSYKNNAPEQPNQYAGKQIILNSGRLVFNSSIDHILFSSKKSINLNAIEGVNIDTPTVNIQSKNIYLGSKNATEPLLLGNQTINLLNQLISNLEGFAQICSTLVSTPPGTPIAPLNVAATQLQGSLNALQANLNNLKSKYNYTV
jgi:hypothetical protein